jgi:glycosyltransferase involved in cell wall biosynthesis
MAGTIPTERPASILFVCDYFHPHIGGGETLFWNVSKALASQGVRVTVVTQNSSAALPYEVAEGVEIYRLSTPRQLERLFFMFRTLPLLLRLARDADIVHAVVYASVLPAWLAAWMKQKAFLVTVHEVFGADWARLAGVGRIGALALRLFEKLVLQLPGVHYSCPSRCTARKVVEVGHVPEDRVHAIYCPVDYAFWDRSKHSPRDLRSQVGASESTFVYLYFGRPGASKGVEYLIEAAKVVRERVPNSRLVMLLARHPEKGYSQITNLINRHSLEKHVVILDPVPRDQLPGYLLGADCVVVPSLSEGFGYSAVEARTIGCRVIATSGHSVEEVIGDFVHLVPRAESHALAEQIIRTAATPGVMQPIESRFTLASHLAGLMSLYSTLLAERSAACDQ